LGDGRRTLLIGSQILFEERAKRWLARSSFYLHQRYDQASHLPIFQLDAPGAGGGLDRDHLASRAMNDSVSAEPAKIPIIFNILCRFGVGLKPLGYPGTPPLMALANFLRADPKPEPGYPSAGKIASN
jgi:hypothetical protein